MRPVAHVTPGLPSVWGADYLRPKPASTGKSVATLPSALQGKRTSQAGAIPW
ncbi:hypothetical protein ATI53_103413 [Salipiger aestuarii]|uniref:Uncharacterized protein n=1 Tax=Salipiger aestuarii TaxID=568098 RepID=A0A327Y011_9RHOB|nr:hypothetical protein ATI53_103413 [Salipiger aestuarii]